MYKRSITSNIFFSVITQIVGIIVPLLIAPYVARVFNADLIGRYSYTLANSTYFVLFECLGFGLYGMIRVAQVRDNVEELSSLFWGILFAKLLLMIMAITIYSFFVLYIGEHALRQLYILMLLNLVSNGIDVTWFLNGIEEFRLVAIQSVLIRILNLILVFVFVKDSDDLYKYAAIMQGIPMISHLLFFFVATKKVNRVKLRSISIFYHVKASLSYFVPGLVNTIFSSSDKTILGSVSNNTYEVGIYEQANKIYLLCISIINAIGNVLLPRTTHLFSVNDNRSQTNIFIMRTIRASLMICIPLSFGLISVAPEMVLVFFGDGYKKSIIVLQILSGNVIFSVVGSFIAQQQLVAQNKQRQYNVMIIFGAFLNVILNIVIVKYYLSYGVAFASVLSSFFIFVALLCYLKKEIPIKELVIESCKYYFSSLIMIFCMSLIHIDNNLLATLITKILLGSSIFFISLFLLKDRLFMEVIKRSEKKLFR